MILPFHAHGWELVPIEVDEKVAMRPEAVGSAIGSAERTAIVHAPFFGQTSSSALIGELRAAQSNGAAIITDDTHRSLSAASPIGDFRIASLRKLLPVCDGAYAFGLRVHEAPELAENDGVASTLRAEAMAMKTAHMKEADPSRKHLNLFRMAEEMLEARTMPTSISLAAATLLRHINYPTVVRRRRSNAASLYSALRPCRDYVVVNPRSRNTLPSHLVLRLSKVSELRTYLAANGVFCPIHWPPSQVLPRNTDWPKIYLSLPVDQRYSDEDMIRAAALVDAFFSVEERMPRRRLQGEER